MAFALVYTAEHYVADVLLGWIYAAAAFWAVNRLADRLEERARTSFAAERAT
jgi:membrane-associated phospholipid phosphatase